MARNSGGMLAISNTKPESIMAGRNAAVSAAWAALNWLRITVDWPWEPPAEGQPLPPERFVTVEDCERVTRQLQYALETVDADYSRLEVSSPGVDRPLKTPAHFARFIGEQIEIALKHPFQGRKHYKGVLCASPDGTPEQIEAGQAWGLLLAPAQPKAPLSRTAAKKQAKAVAKGEAPVSEEVDQVMGFTLDEIREARLVPVVSFKGRRAAAQPAAGQVAVDEAEELGGQKK